MKKGILYVLMADGSYINTTSMSKVINTEEPKKYMNVKTAQAVRTRNNAVKVQKETGLPDLTES